MKATMGFMSVWQGLSRLLVAGVILLLLSAAGAAPAADAPGKKIFLERKCNKCHTVNTEGISKAAEEPDDEEEEETDEQPPDLSGVGADMPADQMDGWLRKKVAIEGKKHPKRFAGNDEERKTLIDWLVQTKPDPKAKKPEPKK